MFVILASKRSGTHLLASLLDSHPDLRCYDEVFLSSRWRRRLKLGRKDLTKLNDNEGCIVMYSHFIWKSDEKMKSIIQNSKVIHLMRRNLENHAKSFDKLGTYTKSDFEYRIKRILKLRKAVFNGRRKFPNLFNIYYEDICGDKNIQEYENAKLLEFLDVAPMKLTTSLVKGKDP